MPGSCGAPGSTKVPPTPPGHLWVPFEPGAMAQPGEGWGQRWEHSRMAWGGCVPLGGGACGEAGIDAPPLLPLGISVQFMGGGTARSKQNQNVFLGCSFTPWFTSGGSWGGKGGSCGAQPKAPHPQRGRGCRGGCPCHFPPQHSRHARRCQPHRRIVPNHRAPPSTSNGGSSLQPPAPIAAAGVGCSPLPKQQAWGGGGGAVLNVGPVVAWEGGEVTPHPVNKRQSLNESTNRSLSAICVWAEGGQRESMQRAEGGGGGNSCPSPPAPGAAPWGSSSCTTPMPTGLGVLPVPCAGGDVGWCTRAQRDGAKQRGWGRP